ncbi:HutD family protein [Stenotrophomonas sp. LGBM10]|uniref:HutD/Ves family protein n=1 Tax=Stenotrophomonas sp. LGBM10 TaxID=3390038 RepID=UPI00398B4151
MSTDTFLSAATRVIPSVEYRRERWRNGLGWTREILRVPDNDDWLVRLSIAEIEQDAAFSAFPGIERELVLLRGEGLRLRFADGTLHTLMPPHDRLRFAGEAEVSGELVDGVTHDFNLMWRRDAVSAELLHRPLVGSMFFFSEPGAAWAIHLLAGQAEFEGEPALPPLQAGDTAWLGAGPRRRYALHGGGELLAIRVAAGVAAG